MGEPAESARLTIGQKTGQKTDPSIDPYRPDPEPPVTTATVLLALGTALAPGLNKLATVLATRGAPRWLPGVVAGVLSAFIFVLGHDAVSNKNTNELLLGVRQSAEENRALIDDAAEDRADERRARAKELEALLKRIEGIEKVQDELIILIEDEQERQAWRDEAIEAIAKAQDLSLRNPPNRSKIHIRRGGR